MMFTLYNDGATQSIFFGIFLAEYKRKTVPYKKRNAMF